MFFDHLQKIFTVALQHPGKCRNFAGFRRAFPFFPLRNRRLRDTASICKLGLGHFLVDPQFFDQVDMNRLLPYIGL